MSKRKKSTRGGAGAVSRLLLRACAIALGVAVLGAVALSLHYRNHLDEPVLDEGESKTVVIPENSNWDEVVGHLQEAGLIEQRPYFEYFARRRHLPARVKAGRYEFEGEMRYADLAEALVRGGRAEHIEITLTEGATIFHMADYLDETGVVEREAFLEAARDSRALALAGLDAESFEGYLFPDTYRVREEVAADEVIELAHARWQAVWLSLQAQHEESLEELVDEHDLDRHDLVTLASLVERETASDEERPIVARVFLNRLEKGMPMQSDPTCVYGEDTYDKTPTPELCKDPLNRYSTYVEDGLPPGPVANPSRASLAAVADPSDDPEAMEYLYFVARRDGTRRHHFSKNFEEHKRAIDRYLR